MKMVLLGEDRSGKSSVLASVTGAGWDAQMQSTHGVSASRFKLGRGRLGNMTWGEGEGAGRGGFQTLQTPNSWFSDQTQATDWSPLTFRSLGTGRSRRGL